MIRLPSGLRTVGAGSHRSGWPFALAALQPLLSADGLLFDDFVERTFLYKSGRTEPWVEPWIGVFHYPPGRSASLWGRPAFVNSLPALVGVVTLSAHLATWLRARLRVSVVALRHPTEIPEVRFDLAEYRDTPALVQVGWFLRNQDAIYAVPVPAGVQKIHVRARAGSAAREQHQLRQRGRVLARRPEGHTRVLDYRSPRDYDTLLSRAVIFGEYLDASASNTIVEAIARRTPVLVNRLPAHEEYLGRDYPLFYASFAEIPALLAPARVAAAHDYLCRLETSWLSPETFRNGVAAVAAGASAVAR